LTQEQIAAEVARQVAEQLATEKAAPAQTPPAPQAEPAAAAPSPAQAGSSTPATPAPAAKVYAIGDTGPGGGVVFSTSGGTYKEVSAPLGEFNERTVSLNTDVLNVAKAHRGGGFSNWVLPSIDELKQVYQLQKAGQIDFRGKLIISKTGSDKMTHDLVLGGDEIPGFPGYRIILAGGGPSTWNAFDFSTGEVKGCTPEEGDKVFSFVAVRSFK
jgi:hypothetical protein